MRGLRASINAFCRWCIHDPIGGIGNWRQQVTACPSADCPLYGVRPRSQPKGPQGGADSGLETTNEAAAEAAL